MKMHPTVNLDESVTENRSVQAARYVGHPSRFPKEQISNVRNAQTEYEMHLSQNAAHSSTYGPDVTSQNWHDTNREWYVNGTKKDQQSMPRNSEKIEQKHKGVDTRDVNLHRYQSGIIVKKCCTSCCTSTKLYLWCVKLCYKKRKCSEHVLGKSTRQFFKRMKKQSKKREKSDEATVAGVSTASHQKLISRSVARKPKKSYKQDELVEVADITVDTRRKRKERKEKSKKEKDKREKREKKEKMERSEHDEEVPYIRDEDQVEDRIVSRKPLLLSPSLSPTDFTKSCCYLCAQNTLAIASATIKQRQSDKCVQVSAHKLCAVMPPELDKSCSPLLLERTVQSSVKEKMRETSILCPGTNELRHKEMRAKKRKKFGMFQEMTRTKCPVGRHAACETDKTIIRRDDNAGKRKSRNEKCCREKNV